MDGQDGKSGWEEERGNKPDMRGVPQPGKLEHSDIGPAGRLATGTLAERCTTLEWAAQAGWQATGREVKGGLESGEQLGDVVADFAEHLVTGAVVGLGDAADDGRADDEAVGHGG